MHISRTQSSVQQLPKVWVRSQAPEGGWQLIEPIRPGVDENRVLESYRRTYPKAKFTVAVKRPATFY